MTCKKGLGICKYVRRQCTWGGMYSHYRSDYLLPFEWALGIYDGFHVEMVTLAKNGLPADPYIASLLAGSLILFLWYLWFAWYESLKCCVMDNTSTWWGWLCKAIKSSWSVELDTLFPLVDCRSIYGQSHGWLIGSVFLSGLTLCVVSGNLVLLCASVCIYFHMDRATQKYLGVMLRNRSSWVVRLIDQIPGFPYMGSLIAASLILFLIRSETSIL